MPFNHNFCCTHFPIFFTVFVLPCPVLWPVNISSCVCISFPFDTLPRSFCIYLFTCSCFLHVLSLAFLFQRVMYFVSNQSTHASDSLDILMSPLYWSPSPSLSILGLLKPVTDITERILVLFQRSSKTSFL
jgi:hypothetical protein